MTSTSSLDPMRLVERGFRFVIRSGDATWRKPGDAKENDIDATDMTTEEMADVFVQHRSDYHESVQRK